MKHIYTTIILTLFSACQKDLNVNDVLSNFTFDKTELLADGQSTVNISVTVSDKGSPDSAQFIFSTNSGVFVNSGMNKVTSQAKFSNGILLAQATLRAPSLPGIILISVQPISDTINNKFIIKDSIVALESYPASITLNPSSFGIASNFINEVKIVGLLKNNDGNFVSSNDTVEFADFLQSGAPANGRFRDVKNITADSSTVSCVYAANQYPIGTIIKIRGIIANTTISDSILLTINQ